MIRYFTALGVAGLLMAQPASAATSIFDFTTADPAAGLGSGPFGSVSVTENSGGLNFVFTLSGAFRIHNGNANHNAFTFSILGDPNVMVSNLTSGFTAIDTSAGTSDSAPPFGTFFTAIDCSSACGAGYPGGYAGSMSFRVTSASALTLASLGFSTVSGTNYYFTSDLVTANGNTGNVGALLRPTPAIPEPAPWAMMLLGFGGIGYVMRRTRVSAGASFA